MAVPWGVKKACPKVAGPGEKMPVPRGSPGMAVPWGRKTDGMDRFAPLLKGRKDARLWMRHIPLN